MTLGAAEVNRDAIFLALPRNSARTELSAVRLDHRSTVGATKIVANRRAR